MLFPSALTSPAIGLSSAWPSAQGPDPVSLMQPALPAGWLIAPVVGLRFRRTTALLTFEAA